MARVLAAALLACTAGFFVAPATAASLSASAEPEVALAVDKLDAGGYLPKFASGTRPWPVAGLRAAIGRAATADEFPDGGFDRALADWLSWYLEPRSEGRVAAGVSADERGGARPLSDGVPVPAGGSLAASGAFRAEPASWLSLQGAGAAFLADGDDRGTRLLGTSVEAGWPGLSVEAGRISTSYGPGRGGGLIFTNNAAPYPGVRIRNREPVDAPGFLSFLGAFHYDLFFARLEGDRPIPHSYLSGMRLSLRTSRYLELGMSRAMHFGGEGRPSGVSAWWSAFKGTHDNDPGSDGNQIGGFDAAVNLPFRLQPVRLYAEAAGEDEAKILGTPIPGPTKWAFLGGVFLPSLLGTSRADLRIEWASNHLGGNGASWYVHGASREGHAHRYRGRILGDPMGTDARRLDLTGHWFLLPSTYVEAAFGKTERFARSGISESTIRSAAGLVAWLSPDFRAEGRVGIDRVRARDFVPGADGTDVSVLAMLTCRVAATPRDVRK
jgi:hypothetical protein